MITSRSGVIPMSSDNEGRGTQTYRGVPNPQTIGKHIHDYQAVLHLPDRLPADQERFTLADVSNYTEAVRDLQEGSGHHLLERMRMAGLLERTREPGGSTPARYRWRDAGREAVRDYLEAMDSLPCGCRRHIPSTRDDPEGVVTCGYCGESYDRDRFEELVANL
jgi:hypothetical protein